jgi:uncharacterized protein YjbI with pentapeptide repeats
MRSALLDLTPIISATACHQRNYVERYSRFKEAVLSEAHLEEAILWRVHLEGAHLWAAHLEGAVLWETYLEEANLSEAHLEGANFIGAYLQRTRLMKTNLTKVKNLTQDQVDMACIDEKTILPEGLTKPPLCP